MTQGYFWTSGVYPEQGSIYRALEFYIIQWRISNSNGRWIFCVLQFQFRRMIWIFFRFSRHVFALHIFFPQFLLTLLALRLI